MKNIMNSIEALESRIAPAVFIVNSLSDPTQPGKVTLRDALAMADAHPGPDTIIFHLPAPPLHGENVINLASGLTSKGDVTIVGPGSGKLIINGGGNYQVLDIHSTASTDMPVTISGVSMVNGIVNGASDGGGIYADVSLTLKNVVISGCTATNTADGGGVAIVGTSSVHPKVSISNSLITGNATSGVGGGISLFNGIKSLSLSNTALTGNTATDGGGGAFVDFNTEGTAIAVSGSVISGNSSGYGGGLFLENDGTAATAKTTITGTLISGNQSNNTNAFGGGGLYISDGKTVITGSIIEHNSAVYNGGGVEAKYFTSLTISNSTISGNQTTNTNARYQGGGGVFLNGAVNSVAQTVQITGTVFTANQSARYGGGLFAYQGQAGLALTVSGSNFSGNSASAGGGIATDGSSARAFNVKLTGGSFTGNTGEAINLSYGTNSITGSKLTGNLVGNSGAGIYAVDTASLTIKNVSAVNNQAGVSGGALYIKDASNFTVSGGSITGNQSVNGGGIYAYNSGGSILGVTISGNVATTSAGGLFDGGAHPGQITVQAAKVTGNTAPDGPDFETPAPGAITYV